jgi:hypothetical protein
VWSRSGYLSLQSRPSEKGEGCVDQVCTLVSVQRHAASSDNRLAGWFPISLDARFQLLDLSASALSFNSSADLDVVYDRVRQYGSFLTHRNLSLSFSSSSLSPQRLTPDRHRSRIYTANLAEHSFTLALHSTIHQRPARCHRHVKPCRGTARRHSPAVKIPRPGVFDNAISSRGTR